MSGLKRSLFPCKYIPRTNQENYVIFNFESSPEGSNCSTAENLDLQPPVTSTMIDTSSTCRLTTNQNLAYQRTVSCIEPDSSTTLVDTKYQLLQSSSDMDMEVSRSVIFEPTQNTNQTRLNNDYEDVTIIKHNNSPMSNYTNYQFDEISMIGNDYCLQSTKLSSTTDDSSLQCVQCKLSPHPNPQQHSTMLSLSPESNSSQFSFSNSAGPNLESIIQGLSMLIDKEDETVVNDSLEGHKVNSETYVCSTDYEATFVDDLSVQFADTVKILRDNKDDWLYVQVSTDGRRGYVPRTIVLDLKQFIKQLKDHNQYNVNSDNQSINLPIKV